MGSMKDLLGDEPIAPFVYPSGPGHRGVPTSVKAAAAVMPRVSKSQKKILDFLLERGAHGATYDEIVTGAAMPSGSVCGRMVELKKDELVVVRGARLTSNNCDARVYIHRDHAPPEP